MRGGPGRSRSSSTTASRARSASSRSSRRAAARPRSQRRARPSTGLAVALLIGVGVAIELSTFALGFGEAQKKQDAYNAKLPGELGFDPLGLVRGYGESEQAQKAMRTAELKNGRTAMVAVLLYVIEEVTTGKPVTQLTPFIFKPFWQIVVEAMGASPMGGDGYDAYLRASEADDAAAAVAEPAAAAAEPAAAVAEPAAAAPPSRPSPR